MTKTTNSKAAEVVAEICLYGNREIGAGWLARTRGGLMLGNGEPSALFSFTDAIWIGVLELQRVGLDRGLVRVFDAGGQRVADMEIARPCYYGELSWSAAPVYDRTSPSGFMLIGSVAPTPATEAALRALQFSPLSPTEPR